MVHFDDLSSELYAPELHCGVETRAVGWLGDSVPTTCAIPSHTVQRLRTLRKIAFQDDGDLGYHNCEICGQYADRGELWLEIKGVRYVAPAMIVHYCESHSYRPPDEFLEALRSYNLIFYQLVPSQTLATFIYKACRWVSNRNKQNKALQPSSR